MIAYVDSSVLLRVVFGEESRLREWEQIEQAVSSELTRMECLRTVGRIRLRINLSDDEVANRNRAIFEILDHMDLIMISSPVLERASQPFPTSLGTLDAIHLCSAVLWQQGEGQRLVFLTHDEELGRAAKALGFSLLGC